jgi:cathepsin B
MFRFAVIASLVISAAVAIPVPVLEDGDRYPIHSISQTVNALGSTWEAHPHSMFNGASWKFIKSLCGALPEPSSVKSPLKVIEPLKDLPENFDSADNWPQCASVINNIRDQGSCGSCWAVSSTSNFNDRLCIASNGTFTAEMSAEDTLSCCAMIDFCGSGCNGGFPSGAWRYFKGTGLVTGGNYDGEGCYPYQVAPCEHHTSGPLPACKEGGGTPSCAKKCQSSYGKDWSADKHKAGSHYSVSSKEEEIMTELMQHGSITAAFTVYSDFPTYKSGVYQHTSGSALGGHAVVITGWGVENGVKYWKVRNSWRQDWGDNGYFKIIRGVNECGIESSLVTGSA